MRLSWNEIRARAAAFAREWKDAHYEKGETQSFYNEFFEVFGIRRRQVASFEHPVRLLGEKRGFIDLFWKGVLLVEHKSAGRNLVSAHTQAFNYFPGLKAAELPRYILLSDFQTFVLCDEEGGGAPVEFKLADLPAHVEEFGFIIGVQRHSFRDQDPVNIDASELMGRLHDALEVSGYVGHNLEQLLVRLVFCLFADATGIFDQRGAFLDLVSERSNADGSDIGRLLSELFEVLNTPDTSRQTTIDEDLAAFPYVNGDLFKERLPTPAFDSAMRNLLIEACEFRWDEVSPAIFGSLFQSVMNAEERRAVGAHYTTEGNILKIVGPLFLDDLRAELGRLKVRRDTGRINALRAFQEKLGLLKFLDPACGCGNFLIIAYRELRLLELEVLRTMIDEAGLRMTGESRVEQLMQTTTARRLSVVDVDQFYGIELGEFPARIAEAAMWMMDHIMNNRLSLEFGRIFRRIPLQRSPHIHNSNALQVDWSDVVSPSECNFILGNPPFVGHQYRDAQQVADMGRVWGHTGSFHRLDYVSCWFIKAADYMGLAPRVRAGLVATNSITQGEQVALLWPQMFSKGVKIGFAHRTFQWGSEAPGRAAVHCVIVGFGLGEPDRRTIFDYRRPTSNPTSVVVRNINGYLIDGPNVTIASRSRPLPGQLPMTKGSQPTDGARLRLPGGGYETFSNLILNAQQREELLATEPAAERWLRPYVGSDELISGDWRWCLWLKDISPSALRPLMHVRDRLERVKSGRLRSPTPSVRAFADYPTLFTQDRQPDAPYVAIPEVSSETREYVPIVILEPNVIASNKLQMIPGGGMLHLGVLSSRMHMAWIRTVAGRLKSDYSYSPSVYYSFVWPTLAAADVADIERLARRLLDTRASFTGATLAVLYNPLLMPPTLRDAHHDLDMAVETRYQRGGFATERERVQRLFDLYLNMTSPVEAAARQRRTRRRPDDT